MVIKEITDTLGGQSNLASDNPSDELHRAWEISVDKTTVILKRYGSFCLWNKLTIEKDGVEVYRMHIKPHWDYGEDLGIRVEFFNNLFLRVYKGDRFSFIEYVGFLAQNEGFARVGELIKAGLDKSIADAYEEKAREMLS